jgi:hypothetical protein
MQFTPMRTRQDRIRSWIVNNLKIMGAPLVDRDSGVRHDIDSLEPQSMFGYHIDGWGLTHEEYPVRGTAGFA